MQVLLVGSSRQQLWRSLGIGARVEDQPFGIVLEQEVAALEQFDLQSPGPAQRAITRLTWELEEGIIELELAR